MLLHVKERMRTPSRLAIVVALWCSSPALLLGQQQRQDDAGAPDDPRPLLDPTGGADTSPTLLFVPAAALPSLNVRVITGVGFQAPAGQLDGVRPHLAGELGVGQGVTLAAGSRWFGGGDGDRSVLGGLTPFGQVRLALFGDPHAPGLLGGAALTIKRVGYRDGEPELEAAFSLEARTPRLEAGANAVLGQSLAEAGEHDVELHLFGGVRPFPALLLGVSGQVRAGIGEEESAAGGGPRELEADTDLQGGAIASLTVGTWQLGTLVGASTLGLTDHAGLLVEVFGAVRFGRPAPRG